MIKKKNEKLPEVVMPASPVLKMLKGQKALVTGANSGIGKGVAIEIRRGWWRLGMAPASRPLLSREIRRGQLQYHQKDEAAL